MENKKDSFTSADNLPIKIFLDPEIINEFQKNKIIPIHLQLSPTNLCNLSCPWCSCANRQKTDSIDYIRLIKFIKKADELGTKAITITGGGEPVLYHHINDLIAFLGKETNIKIGLVTNGTSFSKLNKENFHYLTWCRISHGDIYVQNDNLWKSYNYAISNGPKVDWSFSYVLSEKTNEKNLKNIVTYANEHDFTHIRIVPDLYLTKKMDLEPVKKLLKNNKISDHLIIYQSGKGYTAGQKECYISLLKPFIASDGKIYPCCGVQYALDKNKRDFPIEMQMGDLEDFEKIIKTRGIFNGSKCKFCYYNDYNWIIKRLTAPIQHKEFV